MDSRSKHSNQGEELNFDYYLKYDVPVEQVRSILKHKKMDSDKIEEVVTKLQEARERVRKYARKFIDKIDQHYGYHDVPSIVKKAIKYAEKHELSNAEKDAVISMATKGDVYNTFNPLNQLRYTEMSKFMGIDAPSDQVLNLQAKDHAALAEIVKLFESSRLIHNDIKNQLTLYRDCAVEAVLAQYDRNRGNVSIHIHPVIVALFLPKVDAIERRMLYTNMGRVVIRRATPYINRHIPLWDNVMNGEMEAEWHLTWDIVNDPNSLAYFSDDTPITNMLKRFKIQIELWKNVLNLRQGRLYSLSGYEADDGITGLLRVLSQYDWSYFDSPDMAHFHDEGSVLRKLMAVFSLRPTFAQITTLSARTLMGMNNYNALSRTTFLNIPIINVRLPTFMQPQTGMVMSLDRALSQSDFFIEHKTLVPKHRSVLFTQDLLFFYANRRYQALNLAKLNFRVSYTSVPYQSLNVAQTAINDTPLNFDYNLRIAESNLELRSIVTVYRPPIAENIVGGSSAIVIPKPKDGVRKVDENFYYNPLLANYMTEVSGGKYESNNPITLLTREDSPSSGESVNNLATKYGTIFMYSA
jgi:hypothetical protein